MYTLLQDSLTIYLCGISMYTVASSHMHSKYERHHKQIKFQGQMKIFKGNLKYNIPAAAVGHTKFTALIKFSSMVHKRKTAPVNVQIY